MARDDGLSKEEYKRMLKRYADVEDALAEIVTLQGREGLITEYVILSTLQTFDKDGDPVTSTAWHTNPNNSVPYSRLLGLMMYGLLMLGKECVDWDT